MDAISPAAASPEPPLGILQASVDEKGRLKIPQELQDLFAAQGVTKLFITTFDLKIARLYPIEVWKRNLKVFENAGEYAEEAERIAFLAKAYGDSADIDKSGRVLLPAKLRDRLGLEKQQVWLDCYNGRINVVSNTVFEERTQVALHHSADDVKALGKLGLV